jgi:hypothetical protein
MSVSGSDRQRLLGNRFQSQQRLIIFVVIYDAVLANEGVGLAQAGIGLGKSLLQAAGLDLRLAGHDLGQGSHQVARR